MGVRRIKGLPNVSEAAGRTGKALPEKRRIHVVVDNAAIHRARAVQRYLERLDGRIELWFLPRFRWVANPDGREWEAYHGAVTALHHGAGLESLQAHPRVYFARCSQPLCATSSSPTMNLETQRPHYTTRPVGA